MVAIYDAVNIARTFVKEFTKSGLQKAEKPIGEYVSACATRVTEKQPLLYANIKGAKPGDIMVNVERTNGGAARNTDMYIARDTFISSQGKKPKLVGSQLMSETGDVHVVPAKKGFLGIGKKNGLITVAQSKSRINSFKHDKTGEDMYMTAIGTLENPQNPVLTIGENQFVLTLEKAKQFIQSVLKGEKAYSFQFKP